MNWKSPEAVDLGFLASLLKPLSALTIDSANAIGTDSRLATYPMYSRTCSGLSADQALAKIAKEKNKHREVIRTINLFVMSRVAKLLKASRHFYNYLSKQAENSLARSIKSVTKCYYLR